jgi:hypothetical protein
MNKSSIINKISSKTPVEKQIAEKIFDRIFELVKDSLKKENSFEIENLGNFNVYNKEGAGEDGSGKFISFTPSSKLMDKIKSTHGIEE